MSDTIRVRRVEGKVYPDPRPGRDFIGARKARARDIEAGTPIVHDVPGGHRYVDDGPQTVPNTREIRQAVADGSLELFTEPEPADIGIDNGAPTRRVRGAREERRG